MAGNDSGAGAEIGALIRRLRLHQAGPSPYDPVPAGTTAVAATAGELFRPRRAAVLVCLFRGPAGELRVILTKRSSSLSTHSGERLARFLACPSSFHRLRLSSNGCGWSKLDPMLKSFCQQSTRYYNLVSLPFPTLRYVVVSDMQFCKFLNEPRN
jgi:hypothetical protein